MHAGDGAQTAGEDCRAPRDDDLAEQKQRVASECDGAVSSAPALSEHTPRAKGAQGLHAPRGGARRGPADPGHPAGHARASVNGSRFRLAPAVRVNFRPLADVHDRPLSGGSFE